VGFTRFNAGPLIKLKKAPRQIAQRILSEVQIALPIRATKTDRDRLMFDLVYFGVLRVSELKSNNHEGSRQQHEGGQEAEALPPITAFMQQVTTQQNNSCEGEEPLRRIRKLSWDGSLNHERFRRLQP
jgi:hypothetical protein